MALSRVYCTPTAQRSFFVSPESEHHRDVEFQNEDVQIHATATKLNGGAQCTGPLEGRSLILGLQISWGRPGVEKTPSSPGKAAGSCRNAGPGVGAVACLSQGAEPPCLGSHTATRSRPTVLLLPSGNHSTALVRRRTHSFVLSFLTDMGFLAWKLTSGS